MAGSIEYLAGIIVILLLAIFAFKREALNESGTLMAIVIGVAVFLLPVQPYVGWIWFVLMTVVFLSSTFVTKFKESSKQTVSAEFAKGGVRDFMQVFANGAAGALLAGIYHFYPRPGVFLAYAVVMATVNADTWATELGVLSKSQPFLITNLKRIERGTSGGVSMLGLLASMLGSLVVAVTGLLLMSFINAPIPGGAMLFVVIVVLGGLVGSIIDSLFGATMQAMYWCSKCKKETERRVHKCGTKTSFKKGLKWFDNDLVNLASSVVAGVLVFALFTLLHIK